MKTEVLTNTGISGIKVELSILELIVLKDKWQSIMDNMTDKKKEPIELYDVDEHTSIRMKVLPIVEFNNFMNTLLQDTKSTKQTHDDLFSPEDESEILHAKNQQYGDEIA